MFLYRNDTEHLYHAFVYSPVSHFFPVSIQYLQYIHCLLHQTLEILRYPGLRVFNYCQTSVLSFTNRGILSGYQSLLALNLSGTPSLKIFTSPPSCQLLDNRLYIQERH